MLIKIICIGLITIIISAIIKQYRQDISLIISLSGGLIIVLLSLDGLKEIIDSVFNLQAESNISFEILLPIIKILGIGYITEFCASAAEDVGNKTISSKVVLGGKIAICLVTIPIIKNMLSVIFSLLSSV